MVQMPLGREINSFLWQSNKYLYTILPKDLHLVEVLCGSGVWKGAEFAEKKKVQSVSCIYNLKIWTGRGRVCLYLMQRE